MTPIERQILRNQLELFKLHDTESETLHSRVSETLALLNPKGADEDCCEMDAKRGLEE